MSKALIERSFAGIPEEDKEFNTTSDAMFWMEGYLDGLREGGAVTVQVGEGSDTGVSWFYKAFRDHELDMGIITLSYGSK